MGGVSDRPRRTGAARAACRPARSSRCCSQFRLQASQELLSRLCRAAGSFPGMPCYEHFVSLQKSVFVPLVVFLLSHLGTRTGIYYIDSTALPVCDNDNEIVALKLTPGNVHDTTPVPALTRELTGKLFGDKGSIGQKLAEDLLRLTLFTRVRKNMKALPLSLQDKALLNARNMADNIKELSSLNLSKHRSVINAFVHIIAAITAYQINPIKPKRNLQPRYQLKTTA